MNATIVDQPAASAPEIESIVHDLRNPLSTIHGSAEMLMSATFSEQQVQRIARNVYGASVRMRELLDEFLTRHRGLDRGAEDVDIRDLVARAIGDIAHRAESQAVYFIQRVPANLTAALDRQRIERVLINLFVNALDVMPNGGVIRVSAIPHGRAVLIKVRDTGPGIAPEIRNRLFQPFATAGKANGLGLGLAFSRQAVLDHGGDMWTESSPHGACFAVRLPCDPAKRHNLILMPLLPLPQKCAERAPQPAEHSAAVRRRRRNRRLP